MARPRSKTVRYRLDYYSEYYTEWRPVLTQGKIEFYDTLREARAALEQAMLRDDPGAVFYIVRVEETGVGKERTRES